MDIEDQKLKKQKGITLRSFTKGVGIADLLCPNLLEDGNFGYGERWDALGGVPV